MSLGPGGGARTQMRSRGRCDIALEGLDAVGRHRCGARNVACACDRAIATAGRVSEMPYGERTGFRGGRRENRRWRSSHLVDHELGAGEPDASQHADHVLDETVVIDRLGELEVAEVSRRVRRAHAVRLALHRPVHGSHPRVAQTAALGPTLLVRLRGLDLAHRHLPLLYGGGLG